jgi:hypothetical protein
MAYGDSKNHSYDDKAKKDFAAILVDIIKEAYDHQSEIICQSQPRWWA